MTNHNSVPCKDCAEVIALETIEKHYEKLHPNIQKCPYCPTPNFPKTLKQHISQIHRE